MLKLFKAGWILFGCQCWYQSSAEKKNAKSDSNDIISPCCYRHSCGVNSFYIWK